MLRVVKVRLYPTAAQANFLRGQFGAVRFVYNKGLYLKKHYYKAKGRNLDPIHDLKKLLPIAKKSKKYGWLAEYDSMALQESLRHLKKAFDGFFAGRTGFPHFKTRRGEQSSYHCTCVSVGENWIKVPKLSPIKAVIHRPVTGKVKSITLSMDCCGDFFASILFEDGLAAPEPLKEVKESLVTADDMGLDAFFTDSNKVKVYAPKPLKKALKKVRKASRTLSRRQKGSKNREKARLRLARINRRVKRVRQDFLHKVSRKQVNESQALVFETLKVNNMVRNRRLARSIMDAAWGEYFRMASYKAEREGKRVVKIDQFFPSSKTCSACGHVLEELKLSTRRWTCPACGAHHDRDENAAINLKRQGILHLRANGLVVLRG